MTRFHHTEHITCGQAEDGLAWVQTDDYELLDFIEDHFTENFGLSYDYIQELRSKEGRKLYKMVFYEGQDFGVISEAIKCLDIKEIERIFALNNG